MRSIIRWDTMSFLYMGPIGHPAGLPKRSGNLRRTSLRDTNGAATIHKKTIRNCFVALLLGWILAVPLSSTGQQASQKPEVSTNSVTNPKKSAQRAEAAV